VRVGQSRARTQAQLAFSASGERWWLLNASPDLRSQIEATPALHPRSAPRDTPIAGAILTSADADQVLGLLLLREFQPLEIYATPSVRRVLTEGNSLFRLLERVQGQSRWKDIVPGQEFSPEPGVNVHPVSLPGAFPSYAERREDLAAEEAVLALVVESASGKRLLYAPALPQASGEVAEQMEACDIALVDGTFWSDDELRRVRGSGPGAREIGHVPISGAGGSLQSLRSVRRPRKIYIHINNTNPVLDEDSAERRQVRDGGWEIADDGWEFEL
jgi:pyrroloquinoline quinone biosynthesis protein B